MFTRLAQRRRRACARLNRDYAQSITPGPTGTGDPVTRRPATSPGPFAALGLPLFRVLWLAELTGDLGNWIQTVGAQWVLVHHSNAAVLAALVIAASRTPMLVFAVPMGALADRLDRRRLLLAGQIFQTIVAGIVAVLSALHRLDPTILLAFTFLLGVGSAISVIAFQALIPQIVPRWALPSAVAAAQVNLNLARVVGPPIGGLLVATLGPTSVFVLDALSYAIFVAVLLTHPTAGRGAGARQMRPDGSGSGAVGPRVSARGLMREGLTLIRRAPSVRLILVQSALVTVPSSALWVLLPSISVGRLHLEANGYGMLLASVGVGSICGAALMPMLNRHTRPHTVMFGGTVLAASALAVMGLTTVSAAVGSALFVFGAAWLVIQAHLGVDVLVSVPDHVRARVIAVFQSIRIGGQGVGAIVWGVVASWAGLEAASIAAAASMAVAAVAFVPASRCLVRVRSIGGSRDCERRRPLSRTPRHRRRRLR